MPLAPRCSGDLVLEVRQSGPKRTSLVLGASGALRIVRATDPRRARDSAAGRAERFMQPATARGAFFEYRAPTPEGVICA